MPENQFLQNSNQPSEDTTILTIIKIVSGVFIVIVILALTVYFLLPKSEQSKNIDSATTAARKQIPDAQVSHIKVAGGFALATVSSPSADSQANAGNITIFAVHKNGSMTQLASGSTFSPIDLLEFNIPLATQAQLTGHSLTQIKQNLVNSCGYSGGDVPGYNGFTGSFDPNGWQIDSATLDDLEQTVTTVISDQNSKADFNHKTICINATRKNSDASTDMQTYISTFSLEVQFITIDGKITKHTLTFAIGPHYYHSYTLDGKKL